MSESIMPGDMLIGFRSLWRLGYMRMSLSPLVDYYAASPPYCMQYAMDAILYAPRLVTSYNDATTLVPHIAGRGVLNGEKDEFVVLPKEDLREKARVWYDDLIKLAAGNRLYAALSSVQMPLLREVERACNRAFWDGDISVAEHEQELCRLINTQEDLDIRRRMESPSSLLSNQDPVVMDRKTFVEWSSLTFFYGQFFEPVGLSLAMNTPVVMEEFLIPASIVLRALIGERSRSTLNIVTDLISAPARKRLNELRQNGWIDSGKIEAPLPLSTMLVLRQLRSNAKPSELFEEAFNLRKDNSLSRFRNWITQLDASRRKNDVRALARADAAISEAADNLYKQFSSVKTFETAHWSFIPSLLLDLVQAILGKSDSWQSIAQKISEKLVEDLPLIGGRFGIRNNILFMQKLGGLSFDSLTLEAEFKRCFGEKGVVLAKWIRYWRTVEEYADVLAKQI